MPAFAGMTLRPRRSIGLTAAVACLLVSLAMPHHAAMAKTVQKTETTMSNGQKALGTFGSWRAFSFEEQGQTVCYMAMPIHAAKQKGFNRGASRLTITHRPSENSRDVVSYTAGFALKPGSDVKINIGKASFSLFTAQSNAWTRDPATDRALATALRHAPSLTIAGIPAKQGASAVTDTIDLSGADKAYRAMSKSCGIEVPEEKRPKPTVAAPKKGETKKTDAKHKKDAKESAHKTAPQKATKPHSQPPVKHHLSTGNAPKVAPQRNKVE
ncbi:MAG: invasion associated locus B family protein [Bdellovibrionales bacterium]